MDVGYNSDRVFCDDLREMLDSERNLLTSLVKMGRGVRSPEVAETFELCRADSENQIGRLNRILALLEYMPDSALSKFSPEIDRPAPIGGSIVLDAVLASAIQAVHRYAAARYESLRDQAVRLGLSDVVSLLSQTMAEKAAAVGRLEPLTELKASDFRREEASTDRERTVIISNDNEPNTRRPTVERETNPSNLRQRGARDGNFQR